MSAVEQSPLDSWTHCVSALSWKLTTASVTASDSLVLPFRSIVNNPAGAISPTFAELYTLTRSPASELVLVAVVEASLPPFSSNSW